MSAKEYYLDGRGRPASRLINVGPAEPWDPTVCYEHGDKVIFEGKEVEITHAGVGVIPGTPGFGTICGDCHRTSGHPDCKCGEDSYRSIVRLIVFILYAVLLFCFYLVEVLQVRIVIGADP